MRTAFHHIAYQSLDICNALSWDNLSVALQQAGIKQDQRIADIGCAYGCTSILIAETFGARLTAVDLDPVMTQGALERVAACAAADRIEVLNEASIDALRRLDPFDMILALGTTFPAGPDKPHAAEIFAELGKHITPGGRLVWGDVTWTSEPSEPLRQMVEITGKYLSDPEWKQAAIDAGFEVIYARISEPEEWHHYRQSMEQAVGQWLEANPEHTDAPAMRQSAYRIQLMLDFGVDCLGFGLYVFRRAT